MLVRRGCLQEVGLFDERYFAYCEEADLGVRATRAGWEVGVVWHALVRNPSLSVSVAAVEYLKLRNTLLLVRQHFRSEERRVGRECRFRCRTHSTRIKTRRRIA